MLHCTYLGHYTTVHNHVTELGGYRMNKDDSWDGLKYSLRLAGTTSSTTEIQLLPKGIFDALLDMPQQTIFIWRAALTHFWSPPGSSTIL